MGTLPSAVILSPTTSTHLVHSPPEDGQHSLVRSFSTLRSHRPLRRRLFPALIAARSFGRLHWFREQSAGRVFPPASKQLRHSIPAFIDFPSPARAPRIGLPSRCLADISSFLVPCASSVLAVEADR